MVVQYKGKFGFIKPHFARMDGEIKSNHFLLPSNLRGIEELLNVPKNTIRRAKLSYDCYVKDQVQTQALSTQAYELGLVKFNASEVKKMYGIVTLHLLHNLVVSFEIDDTYSNSFLNKVIYVARNEYPCVSSSKPSELNFDDIDGTEFIEKYSDEYQLFGYDKEKNEIRGILQYTSK